jgi:hypothetical protein
MGSLFSNAWVTMGLAAIIAFGIGLLVFRRGKTKVQPPEKRTLGGTVPSSKTADKTIRLPLRPVGSRDNEIGIREIIRQELAGALGKDPNAAAERVENQEATIIPDDDPKTKEVENYEKVTKGVMPNAEIVNPLHRTIGLYHVELIKGKDYGRTYLVGGQNVFSLRMLLDGSLERLPHNTAMDHPPSEVYRAIHTKEKVREVFGDHDEGDNKLKIGLLVLAACVALFIMFMAIYKGGK